MNLAKKLVMGLFATSMLVACQSKEEAALEKAENVKKDSVENAIGNDMDDLRADLKIANIRIEEETRGDSLLYRQNVMKQEAYKKLKDGFIEKHKDITLKTGYTLDVQENKGYEVTTATTLINGKNTKVGEIKFSIR